MGHLSCVYKIICLLLYFDCNTILFIISVTIFSFMRMDSNIVALFLDQMVLFGRYLIIILFCFYFDFKIFCLLIYLRQFLVCFTVRLLYV